jgi:hypothetical protein
LMQMILIKDLMMLFEEQKILSDQWMILFLM